MLDAVAQMLHLWKDVLTLSLFPFLTLWVHSPTLLHTQTYAGIHHMPALVTMKNHFQCSSPVPCSEAPAAFVSGSCRDQFSLLLTWDGCISSTLLSPCTCRNKIYFGRVTSRRRRLSPRGVCQQQHPHVLVCSGVSVINSSPILLVVRSEHLGECGQTRALEVMARRQQRWGMLMKGSAHLTSCLLFHSQCGVITQVSSTWLAETAVWEPVWEPVTGDSTDLAQSQAARGSLWSVFETS